MKRYRKDPLFLFALTAGLGVCVADAFPWAIGFTASFGLGALASWWGRRVFPTRLALLLLTSLAFATTHAWRLESLHAFPHRAEWSSAPDGWSVRARGRIIDVPRQLGDSLFQAPVELIQLELAPGAYRLRSRVWLRSQGHPLRYGDVVSFQGRIHWPDPPRNPGEFHYSQYLHRQNLSAVIEVSETDPLDLLDSRPHPLKTLALRARGTLERVLTRDLEGAPEVQAILAAMVLGKREATTPEMEAPFRESGTLHLFAVSGLHVGIFALITWMLLRAMGWQKRRMILFLIPLLFFYAFLTGWRPSAIRAATMAAIVLAGYGLHRQARLLNSLGLAALLILAWDTQQWFRAGFQLSFLVLLAILTFTEPLQRPFRRWLTPDPLLPRSLVQDEERQAYAWRRWLVSLFAVSTAAWLGSLPLMIGVFHLVTPIALLANVLLLPLGFFILFTAAASLLFAATGILSFASILLNNANFALVHTMLGLAGTFAQVPGGHLHVSGSLPFARPPCELTLLDLPRGSACAHLRLHGAHELVDTGHARHYTRLTLPYLRQAGINRIDRLWLSHGDTGHTGAGPTLLEDFHPQVYRPPWPSRSPSMRAMHHLLERQARPPMQPVHQGMAIRLASETFWEILYPPQAATFAPAMADDRGLVLRLHYGPWRLLFLSDAGFHTEQWLLDSGQDLTADVLIKGHHASDLSGLYPFLDSVAPRLVIWDSDPPHPSELPAWVQRHPDCLTIDQANVGAVHLEIRKHQLSARGFLTPAQSLTLNRAR